MTPMIELADVSKRFSRPLDLAERLANALGAGRRAVTVHAVDGVSLDIEEGQVVGLVGESGCGKSTLGRIVAGLYRPSQGRVRFRGQDLAKLAGGAGRTTALKIQMIFQDPMSSLNPRLRVAEIVGEAPVVHGLVGSRDRDDYVAEILRKVGCDPSFGRRYPHQFSGGQRQRIGIARALAVKPDFLVCDEAIAALDVSIQAQVINLFMDLRQDLGLTYLFISHDLGVVEHIADRVVIMYLGRIVEAAATAEIFARPNHPYTRALLAEVPRVQTEKQAFSAIEGEIPSPIDPPPGCHFHPRCPHAFARCRTERPALRQVAPAHLSACHLNDAARAA